MRGESLISRRRMALAAVAVALLTFIGTQLPRYFGSGSVALSEGDDSQQEGEAAGMRWPVVARFTERLDPTEGEEWQEDEYFLVARSWEQWGLVLLSSRNVRGSANQGQVGQIIKIQDGKIQTGYVSDTAIKSRLPEMTDAELEILIGAFPTGAEGVSSVALKSDGAMNITPTLNQRWLDPQFRPAGAEVVTRGRSEEENAGRARAAGVRPEAVAEYVWEVCCVGEEEWILVDALLDTGTGLPVTLTVELPTQVQSVQMRAFREQAEESALRAGFPPQIGGGTG